MTVPRVITGRAFINALIDAGIFKPSDHVRRIVIDVGITEIPVMYVERYGDERLLQVATSLKGVQIVNASQDPEPVTETRKGYAETRGGADTEEWTVDPEGAGTGQPEKPE